MRYLEGGRPAERSRRILDDLHPTPSFQVRAEQNRNIVDLDPEGDGGSVRGGIGNPRLGLTCSRHQVSNGSQEFLKRRITGRQRPDFASAPRKDTPIGDCMRRPRSRLPQAREHIVEFSNARAGDGEVTAFQCRNGRKELLPAERRSAAERSVAAGIDQSGHSPYVVVVPMSRDNQSYSPIGIEAKVLQVAQRSWRLFMIDARIDDNPNAISDMESDALAIAWTEKRKLKLACSRRLALRGHGLSDLAISCAQSSPS